MISGNDTETVNEVTVILQTTIPWIIAVMVVLSFIIALFLSRYITKPIQVINANAKKIANLSFDIHCEESRSDELGELSKTINLLSKKLNHALSSLEDELKREKELEERQRLFFAAASHELKTPLTVMKGNLEGMIYGYSEYEDKDKYIAKTLRTSTQMEHLIGEILTLSAIGSDDYSLTKEHFNLKGIVDGLLLHFADLIEMKSFHVITNLQDVDMKADKRLLTKAIQNIMSNALHYSPDKETIKITLTKEMLYIENAGITISENHITNLFDPFYRVDKSRSRQTGGSGLGLYLVKTILDKHGLDYDMKNGLNSVIFEINI